MTAPETIEPARHPGMLGHYRDQLLSLRVLPVETDVQEYAYAGRYLVQAAAQTCIDVATT